MRKILLVANAALRVSLAEQLLARGFALAETPPAGALPGSVGDWPEALVLDAALGGARAAAQARRRGFVGAIVLIADSPDAPPCPHADAILGRPLHPAELIAALTAAPVRVGAYRLIGQNLVGQNLAEPDAAVRLTEKETAILRRLAVAPNGVSRQELLRDVWGYGPTVATRTLETHIHRLRRKIEADPEQPRLLLAAAGGYRLAQTGDNALGAKSAG